MKAKKQDQGAEVVIQEINTGVIELCVLGQTPMIFNRMSEKAWRELLLPAPPKNRASKASVLKHEPLVEYRASVYRAKGESPTEIVLPVQCFKGAAANAALDIPGSSKSQIGRLVWVVENMVPVYGVPQLSMMIVRQAGMNKTPDVRTRAIMPQWAARFRIQFVKPILTAQSVVNLFAAGGLICGVGDFRQEKGKGNYGQFRVVQPDDAEFLRVVKEGGRSVQQLALDDPECFDEETADLLSWYDGEVKRRGVRSVA